MSPSRGTATEGPLSITRLSEGSGMTRQAITRHLHALGKVGLVRTRDTTGTATVGGHFNVRFRHQHGKEIGRAWTSR